MPKITEVRVRYRHVLQPVQHEPIEAEAEVVLVAQFGDGETPDQSDFDTLCDQAKAVVDYQLGIDTVGSAEVEQRDLGVAWDHNAKPEVVSRDPAPASGRRRGANPTPQQEVSAPDASSATSPSVAEVTAATASPSNRRRGAASNPTQAPASQENTSAAPAAASGSRRRGASAQSQAPASDAGAVSENPTSTPAPTAAIGSTRRRGSSTAPSAGSAQPAPKTDLKPSDTSKAASELGRAKGHAAVFTLLEEFACDRVDQLKPDQYGEFVERAIELLKAA